MIHFQMNEPLFVKAEQVLHECRSAPRRSDNENGFFDRLPPKSWEEYLVQGPAQNNKTEKKQIQRAEKKNICPTPQTKWRFEQRQAQRF